MASFGQGKGPCARNCHAGGRGDFMPATFAVENQEGPPPSPSFLLRSYPTRGFFVQGRQDSAQLRTRMLV